jgi:hypothetical protein
MEWSTRSSTVCINLSLPLSLRIKMVYPRLCKNSAQRLELRSSSHSIRNTTGLELCTHHPCRLRVLVDRVPVRDHWLFGSLWRFCRLGKQVPRAPWNREFGSNCDVSEGTLTSNVIKRLVLTKAIAAGVEASRGKDEVNLRSALSELNSGPAGELRMGHRAATMHWGVL